jgi:hypothetical protein
MRDKPTGYETIIVDGSGELVPGPDSDLPNIRTAVDTGVDDRMLLPAKSEVKENVDAGEHKPGTHVATIYYDIRTKTYEIDFHVETEAIE